MATPSGTISLANVNTELGLAATTTISMNQANVRALAGVPSGAISMQNLQNKSNRVTANITISSDTANYVLGTSKVTGYSAGKTDVTLTINAGIFVYSASTGSYAFNVDNTWTTGDTITIINNGTIQGRGGNGGDGNSNSGFTGGPALNVQRAASINNVNRIAGGGGGGGGGGYYVVATKTGSEIGAGGGGGGGGLGISSGGAGGGVTIGSQVGGPGSSGTLTSAGGGGSAGNSFAGTGGSGGSYASSGSNGGKGAAAESTNGGPGGAGGAAVVGNSNITWIAFGTRNGSIS